MEQISINTTEFMDIANLNCKVHIKQQTFDLKVRSKIPKQIDPGNSF